jgi:hypothetical protein
VTVPLQAGDKLGPLLRGKHLGRVGNALDDPLRCLVSEAQLIDPYGFQARTIDGFRGQDLVELLVRREVLVP